MGYVGAKKSLETIRKQMARSRTVFRQNARTQKEMRFCDDNEAFNWCCRHYRYNYLQWHGNVENINRDTFRNYYYTITSKEDYTYLMDMLKEDSKFSHDSEITYLMDGLKSLRKRYA